MSETWVRGTWVTVQPVRGKMRVGGYDCLWFAGVQEGKPWIFIREEDAGSLFGTGYGEGGFPWTVPRERVTESGKTLVSYYGAYDGEWLV